MIVTTLASHSELRSELQKRRSAFSDDGER